jgi:hypothetical protein
VSLCKQDITMGLGQSGMGKVGGVVEREKEVLCVCVCVCVCVCIWGEEIVISR